MKGGVGVVVVLVAAVVFGCLDRARGEEDRGPGQLWGDLLGSEIDEEMAEQLWIYCRPDLLQTKETLKDFGIFFPEELLAEYCEVSSPERSSTKVDVRKSVNVLPSRLKEILFNCLKEKTKFPCLPSKGHDGESVNWFADKLESVIGWYPGRRSLVQSRSTPLIASPAPAPAPLTQVEHPSQRPVPVSVPSPTRSLSPSPNEGDLNFPSDPPEAYGEPSIGDGERAVSRTPPPVASVQHDSGSSTRTIAISVVVTAAGTFLFAALLFCCYSKCKRDRNGPLNSQKDDRPLLAVSFSDFSVSSSHKSFSLDPSVTNMGKLESLSIKSNPGTNEWASPEINSFSVGIDPSKPSLPLPPAAAAAALEAAKSSKALSTKTTTGPAAPPPPPPPFRPTLPGPPPQSPPMKLSTLKPPPGPPPPPPPIASGIKAGPRAPPLPKAGPPPPRPPLSTTANQPSPFQPKHDADHGSNSEIGHEAPKPKLKPFFWDKVLANPDHSMVWHQIRSGSFQFNEEMIETLFGYNNSKEKVKVERKRDTTSDPAGQYVQLLDPKKSQNLSILLRALNVTVEEVCDALTEGHELPAELLQTFSKMSPTADEELKLRLYDGDLSQLLPAERFLKSLVDIPFAFKRMDALLYMTSCREEIAMMKESFSILEVACKELRGSRLFLKLLEAVLKTGNRMNDGTFRGGAQAFKLDTLLKLVDVKGTDGKTTLLHFVVQEIVRSEGVRRARTLKESTSMCSLNSEEMAEDSPRESNDYYCTLGLQVVAGLSDELENVKKAAILDADIITGSVANLGHGLIKLKDFLDKEMKGLPEKSGFQSSLESFVVRVEADIMWLLEEEKRIRALVKGTTDYFHGNTSKDEGLRLFVIVRDFLGILGKVCREIQESTKRMAKTSRSKDSVPTASVKDPRQLLFPAIKERRIGSSGSDSDSSSDDEK